MLLTTGMFGTLTFAGTAGAASAISVSPNTGLDLGSVVRVTGSGFEDSATDSILECNDDPNQPTINALGGTFPVGCSNPLIHVVDTTAAGVLGPFQFTVVEGTVGPPATGKDSAGNPASTDTVLYPCPPTPAQVAAGDSCEIQFPDQADAPSQEISFGPALTTTTDTTTTISATTATTAVTAPASSGIVSSTGVTQARTDLVLASSVQPATGTTRTVLSNGTLAFTGVGNGIWVLAFAGVIFVNLGLLVLLTFYRPRKLVSGAGQRISRIFGRN
jgi:Neocarzinostatin family